MDTLGSGEVSRTAAGDGGHLRSRGRPQAAPQRHRARRGPVHLVRRHVAADRAARQRADRHRARQRDRGAGRVRDRHRHAGPVLGGLREDDAQRPVLGRVLLVHQPRARAARSGWAPGWLSVFAYAFVEGSLYGAFGYFGNITIQQFFHVGMPWPYLAFGALIAQPHPGPFRRPAEFTTVLGVALILEIVVLTVMDRGGVRPWWRADRHLGGADQPGQRVQGPGPRGRHLLRRVVVGGVRDDPELRRGVEEPAEDRGSGAVHLRDRRRPVLRVLRVGGRHRLGPARRGPSGGHQRRQPLLRRHHASSPPSG